MTKLIFKKVMFVGRATTFLVGLAVILALSVGVASTALAGTGVGARFDLGKVNTVNAITKLVGSAAGPSLQIDNDSTGTGATALDLQVEPGKAPMIVNSGARVANLNADRLDDREASSFASGVNGKAVDADKLDGKSAELFLQKSFDNHFRDVLLAAGATETIVAECLPGQVAVTGGYSGVEPGTQVFTSRPAIVSGSLPPDGWQVIVQRNSSTSGDFVRVSVSCVNS